MAEMDTFWNEKHPLNANSVELCGKLIPDSGNCDTLAGELLRASTKITWDWYNNGWGCNNWSGAVCFLKEYAASSLKLDAETAHKLNRSLDYVYEYSHGEPSSHLDYNRNPCMHVTQIHEIIVQGILNHPELGETKNTEDMYDFQEEDYTPEEGDEEGEDW